MSMPSSPLFLSLVDITKDFDVDSELSELNEKQANLGQPYSFGSLRPTSVGMFATAGSKMKKLEKKRGGGRSVLVPVAPPRLPPPSASSSSAVVTPTSIKLFPMAVAGGGGGSFDDSPTDSTALRTSLDETTLSLDELEPIARRPHLSKMFSLPSEPSPESMLEEGGDVLLSSPLHPIGISLSTALFDS